MEINEMKLDPEVAERFIEELTKTFSGFTKTMPDMNFKGVGSGDQNDIVRNSLVNDPGNTIEVSSRETDRIFFPLYKKLIKYINDNMEEKIIRPAYKSTLRKIKELK